MSSRTSVVLSWAPASLYVLEMDARMLGYLVKSMLDFQPMALVYGHVLASKCLQRIELCCKKIPRSLPKRVGSCSMWRPNGLKLQRLHTENNFGDSENTSLMVSVINFRSGLDKDPLLASFQRKATLGSKATSGLSSLAKRTLRFIEKVFELSKFIAWYDLVFLCRSLCYLVHYLVTCFTFQFLLTFL